MRARQRKAILVVVLGGLQRHAPTFHVMALLAGRAHLAAVNVGVTVGTLRSHVGEYWFGVALGARYVLVHASQRVACLVVIELWKVADRLPTREGMTVLTGDRQWSVRTASRSVGSGLRGNSSRTGQQHAEQQVQQ